MSNSKKSNNFFNPIDDDKITEKPNLLPYPHNVGGVVIKPTKEGKLKSKALSAMQQQTETQLNQIYKQIELLAQQAKDIQKRIEISKWIYNAEMGFEPLISETYYLYEKRNEQFLISIIGPNEWGVKNQPYKNFVASVRMLADHTWQIID